MGMSDVSEYSYSEIMQNYLDDWHAQLQSFFCRDDFLDALARFDRAGEDNRLFVEKDLERICATREVDKDALLADRSLIEGVPTREEMLDELLVLFYDNYTKCYSPVDFMTRIVRRLAPEFREDTVRTAILKKFILGAGFRWKRGKKIQNSYRTDAILSWAMDLFSADESEAYEGLSEEKQLEMIVSKLDDSIFSYDHMNTELTAPERFLLISKRLNKWAGTKEITMDAVAVKDNAVTDAQVMKDIPLMRETSEAVRIFCEENGLGYDNEDKNITDLERISAAYRCGMLSDESIVAMTESLLPALEEDFNRFLNNYYYKKEDGTYQKLAKLFKTDQRDERKNKSADWELLLLCDDYASGKFRTNGGKTRILLYYFAMMFDMTIGVGGSGTCDPDRDLEKNLLEDYYNDNVLCYLLEEYNNPKTAVKYESEPVGDGINYKNYVEVIYLYYIFHRELTSSPGESIDRAEMLIAECAKLAAKKGISAIPEIESDEDEVKFTDYYRETYFRRILNLDEKSLPDYLLDHYQILSASTEGVSKAMISSEEETAYDTMGFIMDVLNDTYYSSINTSLLMEGEYGAEDQQLVKQEISETTDVFFHWELPGELRKKYPDDLQFLRIVDNLDKRLSDPEGNISSKQRRVTRGTFLSMCLSEYISQMPETIDSFPQLYRDFVDDVNDRLAAARFQLFKGTNLMDLYILLSLYFYVVKNGKNVSED